ncbi:class I SAM-dependent methyltransferase [Blastopirellula sp. JC732]|uniref:Class I SAM-dependent methyltransferase n=1 Tax=Blastopirellula sediminis TaxID=2894196 RepID=A0A9X1SJ81_9BACT|nr:class I SAM-dependent methyltransferase [Blastopirellula sediminis]MCC9605084.1 class I SAM-dependent methyltransferase [Blastopirellula sediminis]MCC9631616.1 class I SAM-dependent methyltransferase [Blastopirellula sediminis]
MTNHDILRRSRAAWNHAAKSGNRWSQPIDAETVARAREGDWQVILTPNQATPRSWFGDLAGKQVLCLASGGGQQAPTLAAAGADVVSFDLSDEQLALDRQVAEREGLAIRIEQGDMADLSRFADASFDLIFNPCSTVFIPDVLPVWRECARVLRPGGRLMTGFMNPSYFLFDHEEDGTTDSLLVRHRLPYDELENDDLSETRRRQLADGEALEFSHSLQTQIGGQLAAGLVLIDLYEDWWTSDATRLNQFSPTTVATLAMKPTHASVD